MSNDNAAELVSKIRDFNFLWTDLGKVCDLIEQQAAEIKRLNQHKFDYHDTFIDAVGVAAETLGFPLNKQDYNELRGCASADGVLIELTEKVKAEIERLKQSVTENADLRDALNNTQRDLSAARELIGTCRHDTRADDGIHSYSLPRHLLDRIDGFLARTESPASPRPEPGAVAGNAAFGLQPLAELGEDSAKTPAPYATVQQALDKLRAADCITLWRRVVQAGGVGNSETQPLERALLATIRELQAKLKGEPDGMATD